MTNSSGTYTYNYDALGQRVQKTVGGVGLNYLYDLAGREVTRVDTQAGWVSGEVYAGAQHLATYGGSTTIFDHSDWLGTERYRTTVSGGFEESCQSLVFGDGYSCSGSDASVLHFMGKEHDAESDLENFGARYYNSRYARFVTPDWSDDPEPIPYADLTNPQSLNQYVIVHDNPNTFADLDGHDPPAANAGCTAREGAEKSCTGGFVDTTDAKDAAQNQQGQQSQQAAMLAKDPPLSADPVGDFLIGLFGGSLVSVVESAVESVASSAESVVSSATPDAAENVVGPKEGSAGGPGAGKRFSDSTKDAARDDTCVFCGQTTNREPGPSQSQIDHAIPKSRGGNNTIDNAQNTCRTCNLQKGALTTLEYLEKMASQPF